MALCGAFVLLLLLVLDLGRATQGGGGRHRKIVIHVPYIIKNFHHTHTIHKYKSHKEPEPEHEHGEEGEGEGEGEGDVSGGGGSSSGGESHEHHFEEQGSQPEEYAHSLESGAGAGGGSHSFEDHDHSVHGSADGSHGHAHYHTVHGRGRGMGMGVHDQYREERRISAEPQGSHEHTSYEGGGHRTGHYRSKHTVPDSQENISSPEHVMQMHNPFTKRIRVIFGGHSVDSRPEVITIGYPRGHSHSHDSHKHVHHGDRGHENLLDHGSEDSSEEQHYKTAGSQQNAAAVSAEDQMGSYDKVYYGKVPDQSTHLNGRHTRKHLRGHTHDHRYGKEGSPQPNYEVEETAEEPTTYPTHRQTGHTTENRRKHKFH